MDPLHRVLHHRELRLRLRLEKIATEPAARGHLHRVQLAAGKDSTDALEPGLTRWPHDIVSANTAAHGA